MQQLETNAKEMDQISEELNEHDDNTANDYEKFSDTLNSKRRQESELNAKDVLKNAKSLEEARKLAIKKQELEKAKELAQATEPQKIINRALTTVLSKTGADKILNESKPKEVSMSVTLDETQIIGKKQPTSTKGQITNITEFHVKTNDDELNQFFGSGGNYSGSNGLNGSGVEAQEEDDDDDDRVNTGNPMVAGFKETIDSDDEKILTNRSVESHKSKHENEKFLDLSDPEDEPNVKNDVVQTTQFSALDFDFLENLNIQPKAVETSNVLNDDRASIGKKKKKSSKKIAEESDEVKNTKIKKEKKEKKKKKIIEMNESEDELGDAGQIVKKDADYEEL